MNLLLVANFSSPRCGVRNWAEQCAKALAHHAPQITVTCYDATHVCPPIDQVKDYDQILYVWHPGPLGHLAEAILPPRPRTSAWIAEVPPYAHCPFLDRVGHVFSANAIAGRPDTTILAYPVVDWPIAGLGDPALQPEGSALTDGRIVIGWTGIRGVGLAALREICDRRGWYLNASDPNVWLSAEEEILRLSYSTVNVCWYDAGRDEMASAPQTCLAARRPLLINNAPMLSHLFPYLRTAADDRTFEIYGDRYSGPEQNLENWLLRMVGDPIVRRRLKVPQLAVEDYGWQKMIGKMLKEWQVA